ncbi:molybdopterin-guanine dinucleotide biosynthesis protein [Nocardioides cavernaquae]|uniref:Molybdopterin-guanine dinucleotide biosynthesis protein n=1 Tax=Nocardioides cavernaquae TaxID=2321396 RepID=A0A3A5H928_9ACTN|nr:molybdopterin-guanine dinucleotide biosynthesis protein [Nocardioides cavernaquae]
MDPDCQTGQVSNRPATALGAVILSGGTAVRLAGADKASIEIHGRTLLEYALDAVMDAGEVVVVGEWVPTNRPVTFTREDPPLGGPAAGVLAGLDAFIAPPRQLVVLAVDMPRVTLDTIARLRDAAHLRDGAVLVDGSGRRSLAYVLDTEVVAARRPAYGDEFGMSMRTLLGDMDLAAVPAVEGETRDVDTFADLRDLRES